MSDDGTRGIDPLLRLLVEQATEHAMMLIDLDGRIQWWNAAAERTFGIARPDAIGMPTSRLFVPDDVALGVPQQEIAIATSGDAAEDDRWLLRADGSRFWASGAMIGLRDAGGQIVGYGKILRDRTDVREQLETLRNRVDDEQDSNRRKDVFLSTLAHELRGPLAPLRNAVELIRMSGGGGGRLEQPVRIIERQTQALARLVDDLLDVARIGAGKIDLRMEAVVLQEVVAAAVETCMPIVRERSHRLEVLNAPGAIVVEGDAGRLQQVLVNLITNAAKFTPDRGAIWLKTTTEGDEAVVHVEDTGVGIDADMLPRIFELFTQVESSRVQSRDGLGIGLSLVKELATLHGGSVQVRSDGPGRGSKFSVRLPLAKRAAQAASVAGC